MSLLARLVAAGTPPDLIAEVALLEAECHHKRTKNAERQARFRANKAAREAACNATNNVTAPESNAQALHRNARNADTPSPSLTLLPSEEKRKDEPTVRPKAARPDPSTRLPPGWRPSAEDWQFALDEGLSPAAANREVDRFCDYWHSKPGAAGRKLDWPKTWRNWVRTAADRGVGKAARNERSERMAKGFADIFAELDRKDERDRQTARDDETGRVLTLPVQRLA